MQNERPGDNDTPDAAGAPTETSTAKEYGATEPVPDGDRVLHFADMVATWIGANANNGTWYVGGVVAGAAFSGAVFTTLVSNPVAYLVMALIGFIGYKTGISTMALTRPSFGIRGSVLPSVLNTLQFIGWTAVNTFIGAISISFLCRDVMKWPAYGDAGAVPTMLFGIVLMSVLHFISIITGHRSVKIVERIGVVLILILGIWESIAVFTHVSLKDIMMWRPPEGRMMPIGSAMDAMAAFSLGWVPAIAEFTRYCRTKASATIAPMIGANVGLFWFAFVGILGTIATSISSGVYSPDNSDPSTIVSKLGLGVVAFLVIILTSTTANAVNLMAAGVSLTNITKSLKPLHAIWLATIVSALVTVIPLFLTSFLHAFIIFLDYIGMVFGPLLSIVIVDYYVLCRGSYKTSELDDRGGRYWYQGGYHMKAFAVWIAGIVIFLIARNMPVFTSSVGAIYPSMLATGLIYYLAKRRRKA
jgi:putative hydroxymethylpyrimidine transporter CytX